MVHYMVDHLQFMVQHIFYGTAYGTVYGTSYGIVHGTVYGAAYGTVYGTCKVYGTKISGFWELYLFYNYISICKRRGRFVYVL